VAIKKTNTVRGAVLFYLELPFTPLTCLIPFWSNPTIKMHYDVKRERKTEKQTLDVALKTAEKQVKNFCPR
jgi:hypothetical protein